MCTANTIKRCSFGVLTKVKCALYQATHQLFGWYLFLLVAMGLFQLRTICTVVNDCHSEGLNFLNGESTMKGQIVLPCPYSYHGHSCFHFDMMAEFQFQHVRSCWWHCFGPWQHRYWLRLSKPGAMWVSRSQLRKRPHLSIFEDRHALLCGHSYLLMQGRKLSTQRTTGRWHSAWHDVNILQWTSGNLSFSMSGLYAPDPQKDGMLCNSRMVGFVSWKTVHWTSKICLPKF